MSMFKKIKRIFIEEDEQLIKAEQARKEEEKTDEEIVKEIPDIEESTDQEIERPPLPTGEVDKQASGKFIDILLKAIDKHNKEGFDYLEYKTSLQNLSKMDMDESTRYQSAMAMAATMNVSRESIVQSAQQYLSILSEEQQKFDKTVQRQKSLKVTEREQGIKDRKLYIKKKYEEIERIKQEIANSEKELDTMSNSINEDAAKIQATYENFLHAYGVVTGQIQKDVENIKNYVK